MSIFLSVYYAQASISPLLQYRLVVVPFRRRGAREAFTNVSSLLHKPGESRQGSLFWARESPGPTSELRDDQKMVPSQFYPTEEEESFIMIFFFLV